MVASLTLLQIVAIAVALVATLTDLKDGKIYNWLTFPAAACGIIMGFFVNGGLLGSVWAVLGWISGAVIMILLHMGGKMSFGDAKLVAAIGTFTGPWKILLVIFYFCLSWGVWSVFRILQGVNWKMVLASLAMKQPFNLASLFDIERMAKIRKSKMPIAPAIAAGTIIAFLFEAQTLSLLGLGPD